MKKTKKIKEVTHEWEAALEQMPASVALWSALLGRRGGAARGARGHNDERTESRGPMSTRTKPSTPNRWR